MTFTSTDCSTAWMVDITCFSPGIGSPSTAFSATSRTLLTAPSASECVGELSATETGGTGERERKRSSNRPISRSNEKSDDPIQDTIYVGSMKLPSQCGRERLQTEFALTVKSQSSL